MGDLIYFYVFLPIEADNNRQKKNFCIVDPAGYVIIAYASRATVVVLTSIAEALCRQLKLGTTTMSHQVRKRHNIEVNKLRRV